MSNSNQDTGKEFILEINNNTMPPLNHRFKFPDNFLWGASASAFQIEGAADVDGKGLSNWDVAFQRNPANFFDQRGPDEGTGFYEKFEDDVAMMRELGLTSFRFFISWPRLFPNGDGQLNQRGVNFYRRLSKI